MAAPVPRPPQPISATLIVLFIEVKYPAFERNGIAINPPVAIAEFFTKSLRLIVDWSVGFIEVYVFVWKIIYTLACIR